jgi:hypothetical protein
MMDKVQKPSNSNFYILQTLKVKSTLYLIKYQASEHMEEWRYMSGSTNSDLNTRWSSVISFTPQSLYLLGKEPPISIE